MKKNLFIISACAICFLVACNNEKKEGGGGMSAQAEKNIASFHAINDVIESGDMSKLDQYIAADAIDHSGEKGEIKGLDSIKANLQKMHDSYKDMKLEEKKDVADDECVFSLTRFTGTSTTASMGMPSGTSFDMEAVEFIKFNKDGKVSDHWEFMKASDMMKMMPQGMDHNMMDNKMMDNKMKDTTKHM